MSTYRRDFFDRYARGGQDSKSKPIIPQPISNIIPVQPSKPKNEASLIIDQLYRRIQELELQLQTVNNRNSDLYSKIRTLELQKKALNQKFIEAEKKAFQSQADAPDQFKIAILSSEIERLFSQIGDLKEAALLKNNYPLIRVIDDLQTSVKKLNSNIQELDFQPGLYKQINQSAASSNSHLVQNFKIKIHKVNGQVSTTTTTTTSTYSAKPLTSEQRSTSYFTFPTKKNR